MNLVHWAFDHSNNKDPKYTRLHPYFAFSYSLIVFLAVMYAIRGYSHTLHIEYHPKIAVFLMVYLVMMIGARVVQNGVIALYQISWACNLCMIQVIYGLLVGDGRLVEAAFITVSVDQILWYFDIAGYLVKRKFPIGVAKYLIWPQTSNLRRFTSTHHLWFIPLVQYTLGKKVLSMESFYVALVNILVLEIIGRTTVGRDVVVSADKPHVYMNVNLSYQLWKDVKIKFLQVFSNKPFYVYLPCLFVIWAMCAYIFFNLIRVIQRQVISLI